jgi:DNA polymerase I
MVIRAMCDVFERGEIDMHALTASKILGKDPSEVTRDERNGVKPINFGKIYGQGARGLVEAAWEQLGILLDQTVAKEWIAIFDNTYPGCNRWQRNHFKLCDARRSILIGKDAPLGVGRIFRKEWTPPDAYYYTRCCNLPIQGLCADISMLALAYADALLFEKGIEGGLTAWLHDELVAEVREDQADDAVRYVVQAMTNAFAEQLPGAPLGANQLPLIDVHVGKSWAEAKGKTKNQHHSKLQ